VEKEKKWTEMEVRVDFTTSLQPVAQSAKVSQLWTKVKQTKQSAKWWRVAPAVDIYKFHTQGAWNGIAVLKLKHLR